MVLKVAGRNAVGLPDISATTRITLWGIVAVIGSVGLLAPTLHNGWVPHDTGQLGQTAERVLDGELQHRDFDEPYSGGLGSLHALVFRFTGIRAEAMRGTLLAYCSLFVAAVYLISVRVIAAWAAALVAALCASLTLPIYAESMPSWYNLFFTVFGVLALLQHMDTGHRRWLFWAGCCAGCSLVIKITGLYFVATALLYLAFQHTQRTDNSCPPGRTYAFLVIGGCAAFALLSTVFVRGPDPLANLVHFTVPMMAVAGCLAWQQGRNRGGALPNQLREIARDLLPLGLGVALVVGLLLVPYIVSGALEDLYRGLFILPAARLKHAALAPPELKWMCLSLPLTGLVLAGMFRPARSLSKPLLLVSASLMCLFLFLASASVIGYFYIFQALRNQIPLLALAGVSFLVSKHHVRNRSAVFLVVTAAVLGSLVQYPYAYGTYFFYAAPLMVIALVYVVSSQPFAPKPVYAILLLFSLALALLRLPQPDPRLMNGFYDPTFPTASLNLPRCNLTVYQEDARVYQELVELIQAQSAPNSCIYAAPDCPEVYFLSARKNPTRTFYDLFEGPATDRRRKLTSFLLRENIPVVVINHHPAFSAALGQEDMDMLRQHYPHFQVIHGVRQPGQAPTRLFTIFWRGERVAVAEPVSQHNTGPAPAKESGTHPSDNHRQTNSVTL